MSFKDHFSGHADRYTAFRPTYPDALFSWLGESVSQDSHVWDCACGNGQASVAMAPFFKSVYATDASPQQIKHATAHPGVRYAVAPAEASGLPDQSVDLVTVAQALHWFDHDRFYAEVKRVLRPNGLLVVWTYSLQRIDKLIDAIIDRFYLDTVGAYWPAERVHVDQAYQSIPFPFREIKIPNFQMEAQWDVEAQLGYLSTWSAVARYKKNKNEDPIELIAPGIKEAWGESVRKVIWPLHIRAGQIDQTSA